MHFSPGSVLKFLLSFIENVFIFHRNMHLFPVFLFYKKNSLFIRIKNNPLNTRKYAQNKIYNIWYTGPDLEM